MDHSHSPESCGRLGEAHVGSEVSVPGSEVGVQGSGFQVQGSGFRVPGFCSGSGFGGVGASHPSLVIASAFFLPVVTKIEQLQRV